MEVTNLLSGLRKERDELDALISSIERRTKKTQVAASPVARGKVVWTAARKAALSKKMKAIHAARAAKRK